ncbi:MAG TPA: phosphatidylglycerophosphatase A [Smithellaceae bacterium]|nr:phosphatidylglycerophosphatase A [Smithellaceae bacterium]HRS89297.1 phosphatidylglycerophosphatase A [Smithellaceae bacterium]HRV25167.1 phosphatidylglycerophosphatase A [Smithellaceae bacterium]
MVTKDKIIKVLATGFGAGLSPVLPGTAGTLVGVLLCLAFLPLHWVFRFLFVAVLAGVAVYVSGRAEEVYGKKDDQRIVIDEIAGFLLAMLPVAINFLNLLLAFVLFRAFDILKPFPLRDFQKFPGGWGVVADDIGAGIYTAAVLLLLVIFGVL